MTRSKQGLGKRLIIYTILSLLWPLSAWAGEKLPVFVSIIPQQFFVQQIGKDLVEVRVMVRPGASPATYEPKPKQMAAISKAKIYFSIGVPFEKAWLKKIVASNPEMLLVHTDRGIKKIPMVSYRHETEKNHHEHGILDPHIWTAPPLVKIQALTILTGLQEVDPDHRISYEKNYRRFISVVEDLDNKFRDIFNGKHGHQFMVFHPSWGYFAHAYRLKQVPIEVEGKNPKPAQLKGLIEHAKAYDIKVIFVQPQFSSKSAKQIAKEIGGQVVFVDPLAFNWLDNLRNVANKFREALRSG